MNSNVPESPTQPPEPGLPEVVTAHALTPIPENTAPAGRSVGQTAATGMAFMAFSSILAKVVLFFRLVLLARFISPIEFGLVAMAYTITNIASVPLRTGLEDILVQRAGKFHLWSGPAFWMSLAVGLVAMALLAVTAPIGAIFYGSSQIAGLILLIAISAPLTTLCTVPQAKLSAELRFKTLSILTLVPILIQVVVTLVLAALHFGAYAVVIGTLVQLMSQVAGYWLIARPHITRNPQFRRWRYFLGDAGYMQATRWMYVISGNIDTILVGKMLGQREVGLYSYAYNQSMQTMQLLAQNAMGVLFPSLRSFGDDIGRQYNALIRGLKLIMPLMLPLSVLQASLGDPAFRLLFKPEYWPAIPLFQLLSIGMAGSGVFMLCTSFLMARRRNDLVFLNAAASALFYVVCIPVGLWLAGVTGVAVGACAAIFLSCAFTHELVRRQARASWVDLLPVYVPGVILAIASNGLVYAVCELLLPAGTLPSVVRLGLGTFMFALTFVPLLALCTPTTWNELSIRLAPRMKGAGEEVLYDGDYAVSDEQRPLRILYVNGADTGGGAYRQAADLRDEMLMRGHDVMMFVRVKLSDDPNVIPVDNDADRSPWARMWRRLMRIPTDADNIPAHVVKRRRLAIAIGQPLRTFNVWRGYEDYAFPGSRRILEKVPRKPDLIHLWNLHGGYFDLRILPELSKQIPVVIDLQDNWPFTGRCGYFRDCTKWRLDAGGCGPCPYPQSPPAARIDRTREGWTLKKSIYEKSRYYVKAPCQWTANRIPHAILSTGMRGTRLITNSTNTKLFTPGDRIEARKKLGIPEDAFVLMYAAQSITGSFYKDYPTLRAAMEILGQRTFSKKLVFLTVGGTGQVDPIPGVEAFPVKFIYDRNSLVEHYRASDLFLHAGLEEVWGLTMTEAMSCGTPVVASAVGGIPEQVWHEKNGLLVPPQDPQAFADAVTRLLSDDVLRQTLSRQAHEIAYANFGVDLSATKHLEWYRQIVNDRSQGI